MDSISETLLIWLDELRVEEETTVVLLKDGNFGFKRNGYWECIGEPKPGMISASYRLCPMTDEEIQRLEPRKLSSISKLLLCGIGVNHVSATSDDSGPSP